MVDGISKIDKHLSIFEWGVMLELLAFFGAFGGSMPPCVRVRAGWRATWSAGRPCHAVPCGAEHAQWPAPGVAWSRDAR